MKRSIPVVAFLVVTSPWLENQALGQSSAGQAPSPVMEAPQSKQTSSLDSVYGEALRLSQQGKFDEALSQLQALAADQPHAKGLSRALGMVYYKKSDFLTASAKFKTALEEDAGDAEAIQLMGLSYYLAGRPAEAIAPLEKVQTWYPNANVDASYILGICYIQTKDYA